MGRVTGHVALWAALILALARPPASQADGSAAADVSLFSGDRQMGDQALSLGAGLMLPLFFQDLAGSCRETNLSAGGAARFEYSAYLTSRWRFGLAASGAFAESPNDHTLYMIPLTLEATRVFDVSRFSIPVSLGLGASIVGYREWVHVDLIAVPALGCYWRYDSSWSFGLRASWWLDFQGATANQDPDQARLGDFLVIAPGFVYHVQ